MTGKLPLQGLPLAGLLLVDPGALLLLLFAETLPVFLRPPVHVRDGQTQLVHALPVGPRQAPPVFQFRELLTVRYAETI